MDIYSVTAHQLHDVA